MSETLQASQERIGNTRLGSLVGCGVDCSLSATEAVVNKILPPTDSKETGEEDESTKVEEEGEELCRKKSVMEKMDGLRSALK